jgi:lipopolysaccharide exporter
VTSPAGSRIGSRVSRSAVYMVAAQLLGKAMDFVAILIVARFLTPADFGLVAIATSVMLIVSTVTDVPAADALIRGERLERADTDTAFTVLLMRGLLLAGCLLVASGPVAAIFNEPRLGPLLGVLAIVPLIQGASSPGMIHAMRDLNYRPLALAQFLGKLSGLLVIVLLALVTRSYWALVGGLVAAPIVTSLATHVVAPYLPRLTLSRLRRILSFTGWLTLARIISAFTQQTDRLFVGAFLGKAPLGQYAMAGDLSGMATYTVAGPVSHPLYAGLAAVGNDIPRLRDGYLRGQQMMFTLVAPIGVLFALQAENFVRFALGEDWLSIVPLIWWLAPAVAFGVLALPVQALAMTLSRTDILAFREVLSFLIRLPATVAAAWFFGLVEAAAARAVATLLITLLFLLVASRLVGAGVWRQLANCWRCFTALAAMTAVVTGLASLLPHPADTLQAALTLVGLCAVGLSAYALALLAAWHFAGRPEGAESFVLERIRQRLVQ